MYTSVDVCLLGSDQKGSKKLHASRRDFFHFFNYILARFPVAHPLAKVATGRNNLVQLVRCTVLASQELSINFEGCALAVCQLAIWCFVSTRVQWDKVSEAFRAVGRA